jgi:hypothetical protein
MFWVSKEEAYDTQTYEAIFSSKWWLVREIHCKHGAKHISFQSHCNYSFVSILLRTLMNCLLLGKTQRRAYLVEHNALCIKNENVLC